MLILLNLYVHFTEGVEDLQLPIDSNDFWKAPSNVCRAVIHCFKHPATFIDLHQPSSEVIFHRLSPFSCVHSGHWAAGQQVLAPLPPRPEHSTAAPQGGYPDTTAGPARRARVSIVGGMRPTAGRRLSATWSGLEYRPRVFRASRRSGGRCGSSRRSIGATRSCPRILRFVLCVLCRCIWCLCMDYKHISCHNMSHDVCSYEILCSQHEIEDS